MEAMTLNNMWELYETEFRKQDSFVGLVHVMVEYENVQKYKDLITEGTALAVANMIHEYNNMLCICYAYKPQEMNFLCLIKDGQNPTSVQLNIEQQKQLEGFQIHVMGIQSKTDFKIHSQYFMSMKNNIITPVYECK